MDTGKQVTERIRLWGIVQGVGFRPFVAKTADRLHMKGEVLNIGGLVEITVTDTPQRIDAFIKAIQQEKPVPAEIVHIKRTRQDFRAFNGFAILHSGQGDDEAAMIPADLAVCPDCLAEMRNPDNPRYGHPFISCMVCGPRYTIIDRVPYDRENTTMVDFPMCSFCEQEYTSIRDRRYHAQTISCHDCGPQLSMTVEQGAKLLKGGEVIAFKSMGGYNLLCDPLNDEAVAKLREIKKREQKPFAVMFRDMEQIRQYCYVSEVEGKLLASSARPILLLEHKPSDSREIRKSRFIGSFLPSMGAQYLLLEQISPLIVTSANLSEHPIIKDDEKMKELMEREPLIKAVISNERRIQARVDDSVARVIDGQPQMIRRSKGYAPVPLYVDTSFRGQILAAGGQLKNSFALTKGPFVYMSQYLGDMDSLENQGIYKETMERMQGLFRIKPQMAVCDLHPRYATTAFAEKLGLPLMKTQHHHAHVASVMAEHNLDGEVIGVSFDGTGYGTDGAIWGGEFLLCQGGEFERMDHLRYVRMLGGDASMKEAWKSAVSYLHAWETGYGRQEDEEGGIAVDLSRIMDFARKDVQRDWPGEALARKAISTGINTIKSSSMGRLFDAVAALLGIKDRNDYEGQCAILLEDAAANPEKGRVNQLALEFHHQIARMILDTCARIREKTGVSQVALTGGVFQNKILMEESLCLLREHGFEVFYNISVSPNDGGIALGQAYIAMKKKEAESGN